MTESFAELFEQSQTLNKLKPGEYRLACMAKPKGPVVVEMVEQ